MVDTSLDKETIKILIDYRDECRSILKDLFIICSIRQGNTSIGIDQFIERISSEKVIHKNHFPEEKGR